MKIIIIGAGISGLSSYLLLRKHLANVEDVSIHVYEAYDIHKLKPNVIPLSEAGSNEPAFTPVAIGNAIGIGKNGLHVLDRMYEDGRIMKQAIRRGNAVTGWRMSNARGWTLANTNMGNEPHDDNKTIQSSMLENTLTLMIARQDLWEIIRDRVLEHGDVVSNKRVASVDIGDPAKGSVVSFEDGTSDTANLVIGADGLRSILRRAMFHVEPGETVKHELSSEPKRESSQGPDYITPNYEGLGSVGGFIPTEELQQDSEFDPKVMNIVFGPNGFFGYGCTSSSPASKIMPNSLSDSASNATPESSKTGTVSMWWSTSSMSEPYPYHTSPPSSTTFNFDSKAALDALQTRHKNWRNPTIQRILTLTAQTGLTSHQYYPTWTTPVLPYWSKNGNVILIGDAAHTLQTSSGQGASQALEDAEALALLLKHYLTKTQQDRGHENEDSDTVKARHNAIKTALEKFEALRMPRISMIHAHAQKTAMSKKDMGFVMEMVMYFFIWLSALMPDSYSDAVMNYDLPGEVERIVKED